MKTIRTVSIALFLIGTLVACGAEQAYLLGAQRWQDIKVFVEVRPSPPKPGMHEFLVVGTRSDGKPAHNMIVSIKMQEREKWVQTIQDGHSGVYRRAIRIHDPSTDILKVLLQSGKDSTELHFPIRQK